MSIKLAVVYHSGYGHTDVVAEKVAEGAGSVEGVEVSIVKAADITSPESEALAILDAADAMIFGSPTYMGSAAAPFKAFMEASSSRWMEQRWVNKMAAGFANSAAMNGDKQNTLIEFMTFAMQHGMVWVGQAEMGDGTINRLGSNSGVMAQVGSAESAAAIPDGDLETAKKYGARVAEIAGKLAA